MSAATSPTGLVGEGYRVVGADALSAGVLEQVPHEVEFIREDIPSPQMFSLMRNIDVVFHFAAKNCVSDCQNHPHEAADVNILGTLNIFEATRAAGRNPRIEYAGKQLHKVDICHLQRSTAFLVPSEWYEAFPRTILEAFTCAVPVIASRIGTL